MVGARNVWVARSCTSSAQARSAANVSSSTTVAPPSRAGIAKCIRPIPNAGRLNSSTSPGPRGDPSAEFITFHALARWVRITPFGKPVVPEV